MMRQYIVAVATAFESFKLAIVAANAVDAQIEAAQKLEAIYEVDPAKWERGECGSLVRTFAYNGNPFEESLTDDGFRAIVRPAILVA